MSDDNELPSLRPETLAALKEFLAEKKLSSERAAHEAEDAGVCLLTREDWQLSQFWYSETTCRFLAAEVGRCTGAGGGGGGGAPAKPALAAFLSSPSAFKAYRAAFPAAPAVLLEFDERFSCFGEAFHRYDYNAPLVLPAALLGRCAVLMLDPPFLQRDCLAGFAKSVRALAAPSARVLLATGAVQLRAARELLGLRPTRAAVEHADGRLSNPFKLFTNCDAGELGGWDVEAEEAEARGGEASGGGAP
jgi:hypothetical protein